MTVVWPMNTSMLVGTVIVSALMIDWSWRGAKRFASAPGLSDAQRQTLRRHQQFRWLSLVVSLSFVIMAFVAWQRQALSLLSTILLVAVGMYTIFGQTGFVVRYALARRPAQR